MKIVISCHLDTIFQDPFAKITDGILEGACDNIASVLATSFLMHIPDIIIELTEEEEMHMDGARYAAKRYDPATTLIIVMDVTDTPKTGKYNFTIENWRGVRDIHIKRALRGFKYKMTKDGTESEAWLYREFGYSVIEIDIPVRGGHHNLQAKAKVNDIITVSEAIKALITYFRGKERGEISDNYKVE